jgi:serine/threonine protein kinase
MLGITLVSRYKIIKELSHGGFGQTFIAEDLHLPGHPKCAIKQLKPIDTRPEVLEAAKKLFDREAQTLYKLGKHNQIPSLLAHFEQGAEFYLAQEFIEGRVLSEEIQPSLKLSESYVIQMMQDLLQILDFVHREGVIHRDIKPSNLIRRFSDDRLVLIDFGAVKESSIQRLDPQGHTCSTIVVGTYGYMPNEQANGRPKFASDIYAVGMLAVQALTGISPNQLPEDYETGEAVWRDRAPSISPELGDVLDKMVRSHFAQRYQSASEALVALQKVPVPIAAMVAPTILPEQATIPSILANISANISAPPQPLPPLSRPPATAPLAQQQPPIPSTSIQPEITTVPATSLSQNGAVIGETTQPIYQRPQPLISSDPTVKLKPKPVPFKFNKQLIWLTVGGVAISGAIASYVFVQNEGDKRLLASLEQVKTAKNAGNFSQCIEGAKSIPISSRYGKDAETLLSECQTAQTDTQAKVFLTQAQKLAKENKLEEAIAAASKVSPNSSSHGEAQKLLGQWSENVVQIATKKFQEQGKTKEAIALIKAIPSNSPNGKKAQELATAWQAQANADEVALKAADKALKEGKWKDAIASSNKVKTAFWKKQTEPIIQKANAALNPAPAPAPVAAPVQATQPEPAYVEPAPVYRAPAPVYREPEPAYVAPPPPRYNPPEVENLPAPSKGN